MKTTDKAELFETSPIPVAVTKLCIPTVLASLVMVLYNLADTFFVGELDSAVQNAGVTLVAPILLAFNAGNNLFGVGTSSKMSRALGSKDYDTVYRSSAFGFYSALFFSIVMAIGCTLFKAPLMRLLGADDQTWQTTSDYFFWTVTCGAVPAIMNVVISYLVRAEGEALHASVGMMSGCILNIILDPVFILPWGLDMGAAGAGLATFVSNCFACVYFLVILYLKRSTTYVCINPKKFSFRREIAKDICVVGIPASIQNLLNVTGMTILNNFTAAYNSAAAVAAMGISHKISLVPMYCTMGLSQGIMPLISYNYASGNIKRMKQSISFTTKISMGVIVMLAALLYFGSGTVTAVFLNEPEVVGYGTRFLRGMSLALPFLCFDFVAVAVFQACGLGGNSLVFAILRKLVLEIPALFVLDKLYPLYGLAYAQLASEVVLAAAAAIVLANMFRRLQNEQKGELNG